MQLTKIAGGLAVALFLAVAAVPAARAQDTSAAEQPAAVANGLLEQLGVDARPAAELGADELQARIDKLTAALDQAELAEDARAQLTALLDADRQELAQRQAAAPADAAAQDAATTVVEEPAADPATASEPATEAAPAAEEQPAATEQPAAAAEEQPAVTATDQPAPATTAEEPAATAVPEQPAAVTEADPAAAETAPSVEAPPQVSAAAEEKAAALLADKAPAESLGDEALKARVEQSRALLDEPELSRKTAKALRQRLKADRNALRARVAAEETAKAAAQAEAQRQAEAAAAQQPATVQPAQDQPAAAATQEQAPPAPTQQTEPSTTAKTQGQQQPLAAQPGADAAPDEAQLEEIAPLLPLVLAPTIAEIPMLLRDRRPAEQLADDDLNRRILATREALREDEDYSTDELTLFDRRLQQDREELNDRLLANRSERAAAYQEWDDPNVDINTEPEFGEPEAPNSIFAAEVDDEEMWDQITAAPLEPLTRRYSRHDVTEAPDEIMNLPEVREAIPSIELDTITFGFNEAFVREEEIFDLDRIARMIERVVASHPDEIFMIEGHTDAVGADAYNLKLSRQRALAVKTALTRYYVIPPSNLATVGLGERYLKIWTPEAEEENRRVTVRRVTPLVQGYNAE